MDDKIFNNLQPGAALLFDAKEHINLRLRLLVFEQVIFTVAQRSHTCCSILCGSNGAQERDQGYKIEGHKWKFYHTLCFSEDLLTPSPPLIFSSSFKEIPSSILAKEGVLAPVATPLAVLEEYFQVG